MTVRRVLQQLKSRDIEVRVLGASVFDTHHGMGLWQEKFTSRGSQKGTIFEFDDNGILNEVLVTSRTESGRMLNSEQTAWLSKYVTVLDDFKPDLVMTYGGLPLDLLTTHEARRRNVPITSFLFNGNYQGVTWCRDVDLILTDSDATRDRYREREGFEVKAVGTFIRQQEVVPEVATRERVLFVNPSLKKGAAIVAALAAKLEVTRPDILFEIVEARGDWSLAQQVSEGKVRGRFMQTRSAKARHKTTPLRNVVLTSNTTDMRPVFGRARILLVLSLGWDSGPRVSAEAMMNGIPVIASKCGGLPEQVEDAGIVFDFPDTCNQPPYATLPPEETLVEMAKLIEHLYDDDVFFQDYSRRTQEVVARKHDIEKNTDLLISHLMPYLERQAGDQDFEEALRRVHKHGSSIKKVV